jgi:phage-related minor tail protein
MADNETMADFLRALLEQTRAIRDLKLEVESLKQVLFAHRPAFIPAYEEQVKKTAASPQVQRLEVVIQSLENAVRQIE